MTTSQATARAFAASLSALGIALAAAPIASADPVVPPGPPAPAPALGDEAAAGDNSAAVTACSQFASALDVAASNYGDFANNIAGEQAPNYADPIVSYSNVTGRTALREAAAVALDASSTPGLQPDIASPMRGWSGDATKLLVMMGLRLPRDTLNAQATDLNSKTEAVQMACAQAGTHA